MGLPQPNAPSQTETTLAVVTKGKTVRPDKETKARDRLGEAIKRRAPLAEIRRLCADVVAWAVRSYAIDGAQLAPALREVCEQISLAIDEETATGENARTSFERFCALALEGAPPNMPSPPDMRVSPDPCTFPKPQDVEVVPSEPYVHPMAHDGGKRAAARALGEAGYTPSDVGRRLEVDPSTVRRWFAQWGMSRPRGRPSAAALKGTRGPPRLPEPPSTTAAQLRAITHQ